MTATTQKAYIGMGMEGSIARWYEKTTRRDMDEFRKLAARLRELLPTGGDVLEVAPGPGFLSVELARNPSLHVTALEISHTFVEIARRNAAEAGVNPTIVTAIMPNPSTWIVLRPSLSTVSAATA